MQREGSDYMRGEVKPVSNKRERIASLGPMGQ